VPYAALIPASFYPLRGAILLTCILVSACVSHEPRKLVPNITLSPEQLVLTQPSARTAQLGGVDFGVAVTVNESDSLFNIEVLPGIRVQEVTPGGPAELAGLQAGDVILDINGTPVNEPDTLAALARQGAVEDAPFAFRIRRGTAVLEASVTGRSRASAMAPLRELYRSDPLATRAGYTTTLLQTTDGDTVSAARVVNVADESPLRPADIRPGDLILALDGESVQSGQGLVDRLAADYALGDEVNFTLYRDDALLERRVRLWDPGRRISRLGLRPLLYYESSLAEQRTRLTLLDFWLFAVYRYDRNAGERQHRFLELFSVSSDYGQLIEEAAPP
jgi:serine protease Do